MRVSGQERIERVLAIIKRRYENTDRVDAFLKHANESVKAMAKNAADAHDTSSRLQGQLVLAILQDKFEKGEL